MSRLLLIIVLFSSALGFLPSSVFASSNNTAPGLNEQVSPSVSSPEHITTNNLLTTDTAKSVQLNKSMLWEIILITVIFTTLLYPLSLYLQYREDATPFWFSLTGFGTVAFLFTTTELFEAFTAITPWLLDIKLKLIFIFVSLASTSLLLFFQSSFTTALGAQWKTRIVQIATLCISLILLLPTSTLSTLVLVFISYWTLQFILSFKVVIQAFFEKQAYANYMLTAYLIVLICIVFEVLNGLTLHHMPKAIAYGVVIFAMLESHVFAKKFANIFELAESLSGNLKTEVARQTAELNQKNLQLEQAKIALQSANESLKKLSITDGLTQLYNRRHFDREFQKEWRRCCRHDTHLTLLMIDIDHFKQLNDSVGHIAGDQALKLISRLLLQHFRRAGELVARFGGEEFAIILPNTKQALAVMAAEALRAAVERERFIYANRQHTITISIGLCSILPSKSSRAEDLLLAADSALFDAKKNGRNQISIMPILTLSSENGLRR